MSKYYTHEHEWVELAEQTATIGISDYAQQQMGDVIYVELPELGASFAVGDEMAVVESAKSASDLYAPISGEVVAVNEGLQQQPELVNQDPEGQGWLVKLRAPAAEEESSRLLSEQDYQHTLASLED